MTDPFKLSKIKELNARYFGISELEMISNAGKALAKELNTTIEMKIKERKMLRPRQRQAQQAQHEKENEKLVVTVICGLGNNGADAIAMLTHAIKAKTEKRNLENQKRVIKKKTYNVQRITYNVLLIGRAQDLKTPEAKNSWEQLKAVDLKLDTINIKQDAYAKDIQTSDIIIEALVGSGIKGKLNKRFADVIKKISKMKAKKIAIDSPAPGYTPDETWSLITPKRKNAKTFDIGLPKEVETHIGPGEIEFLYQPTKNSYKSKNGEVLVIGGSETFHGAPLLAIQAASKFVGSVFFYTSPENREFVNSIKSQYSEFIALKDTDLEKYAEYVDVILAGPGLQETLPNQAILTSLLNKYPEKPFVLDAYAISMANPKNNPLNKRGFSNCILTPHRGELRHIFNDAKLQGFEGKLRRFCMEENCELVLKGSVDILFNREGEMKFNKSGNPGMAKGGTGDIMAGLIAAFAAKNSPWEAAKAGTFLSGAAGDKVAEKFGYNFSASDLLPEVQKTFKELHSTK